MSSNSNYFRTSFAKDTFERKYAKGKRSDYTWADLAEDVVDDVCGTMGGTKESLLPKATCDLLVKHITDMKFIPGGRYLYYAGRPMHAFNNCYLLKGEEDTREEWGRLMKRASDCLMLGGGIGVDYSVFREKGRLLSRTGGEASGPLPLMQSINEIGRNVMQGGSRRSAIYASLNWQHGDAQAFLNIKNWNELPITQKNGKPYTVADAKRDNFNFPAPLDMTNASLNYDQEFLITYAAAHMVAGYSKTEIKLPETYVQNARQACKTGEPGFSFNFGDKENETLRNACCEVTSEDDSDVCNLGSLNLGTIQSIYELEEVAGLASMFLVCGTLRADLPYEKVYKVREKNRRLGLGLMGVHEWLLKRNYKYEVVPELQQWLEAYRYWSEVPAKELCDDLSVSTPVAFRAVAPTGTIGIMASTTTGIEPLYAVAYKRRYLSNGTHWKYQYVVDATADRLIKEYGLKPEDVETAASLAADPERRIKFQADVQDYVDMAISSTINMPAWGSELNNEDTVLPFARTLAKYASRLRGFTCYPDGSRGGQPLTPMDYHEAVKHSGVEFSEHDICSITDRGDTCGG